MFNNASMALTLNTAANLNKLRQQRDILGPEKRQAFAEPKKAEQQLTDAIDGFFPKLDESSSDGAPGEPGVIRYHTGQGERIQVTFSGDSKKGEYVQEWVDGPFLYARFDQDSVENYQVSPGGVSHLHIDRKNPRESFLEMSPPGFSLLTTAPAPDAPPDVSQNAFQEKDGIRYATLTAGSSEEAADRGEDVMVHYTGWLKNGESFDSSVRRGKPFTFPLGQGRVIQGWERGVEGMKVGEKRLLDIPADLAYGDRSVGTIPANSPLLFQVELLSTSGQLTRPKA